MSTKAMRNALDALVLADARLRPLADLACAEVEAIEDMARAITEHDGAEALRAAGYDVSVDVLERIAKDAR